MTKKNVVIAGVNHNLVNTLAPLYLKAYALENKIVNRHYEIELMEFTCDQSEDDLVYKINSYEPVLIGFSCYPWNLQKILRISAKIKKSNNKIILGGPSVSRNIKDFEENKYIDLIVNGEGEITFAKILERYASSKNISGIDGTIYRLGEEVISAERGETIDLQSHTSPFQQPWYQDYLMKNFEHATSIDFVYETTRGCPFNCAYCGWQSKRSQSFSVKQVQEDLKRILSYHKISILYVCDSCIFTNRERAKAILETLHCYNSNGIPIGLELNPSNGKNIDEVILPLMEGFHIYLGLQTTNQNVLKAINRVHNARLFAETVKKLSKACYTWVQVIAGLPYDTYEGFIETLKYALRSNPTGIVVFELEGVPGSPVFEKQVDYGLRFADATPHKLLAHNYLSNEELLAAKRLGAYIHLISFIYGSKNAIREYSEVANRDHAESMINLAYYISNRGNYFNDAFIRNSTSIDIDNHVNKLARDRCVVEDVCRMTKDYVDGSDGHNIVCRNIVDQHFKQYCSETFQ